MTRLRRIIVVGRDAPLWLTAASIQAALAKAGIEVTAVELPSTTGRSEVQMSLPPLRSLHDRLGLSEADALLGSGGAVSLGQYFRAGPGRQPWFHAWSEYGAGIDGHDFFDCWLKASHLGLNVPFADFNPAAVAARHGLMLVPDGDGLSRYGYHLPARAYADLLKGRATELGVAIQPAATVEPDVAGDGASLKAVVINGGDRRLDADLLVDVSQDAVLAGALAGAESRGWSAHFPARGILWARVAEVSAHGAYADVRPGVHGWSAMVPVQSGVRVLHLFDEEAVSADQALTEAEAAAGGALDDVSLVTLTPGMRRQPWNGNVVALGEAACQLDPVHSASLHALHLGIAHLLSLFPAGAACPAERAEYNRIMRSSLERIRDFQAAFYAFSSHQGPFWDRGRATAPPQSLSHKVGTFEARGAITPMEDESFGADSWRAQLLGAGFAPESWSPSTDRVAPDRLQQEFRQLLSSIKAEVLRQPRHDLWLTHLRRGQTA